MLDCSQLQQGKRYLYKGKYLTYQCQAPGVKPTYIFHTSRGALRKLSQEAVKRDMWAAIDTSKLEAFNEE